MDEIVDALRAEQEALAAMVDTLDRDGLARPSRCEGWTVADVLLHLAQTNEIAVASAQGRFAEAAAQQPVAQLTTAGPSLVDDWAAAAVAADRTDDLKFVRARWTAGAEAQAAAFAACDPRARVQWVAGDMAARTLATTRLTETWIHAGDESAAATTIRGDAVELCEVAGQRRNAADTHLAGNGPEAAVVLELVRTFA